MLESERLFLVPLDVEMMDSLIESNESFFNKYGYINDGGEFLCPDEGYLLKIKQHLIEHPEEYPLAVDHLIVLKESKTVIGTIYFKRMPIYGTTEVGYGMTAKYEGHGYMTEALATLLEFGKNNGVTIVFADTLCNNIKSQNVLERNGFIAYKEDGNIMFFNKMLMND